MKETIRMFAVAWVYEGLIGIEEGTLFEIGKDEEDAINKFYARNPKYEITRIEEVIPTR